MNLHHFYRYAVSTLIMIPMVLATFTTAAVYEGYTLVAVNKTVTLYDPAKKSIKTWNAGSTIQTAAYLLPDGSVLVPIGTSGCYFGQGAHANGRFQRIGLNGTVVWDYKYCTSSYVGAYDIEPMPNGNVLVCVHVQGQSPGKVVEIQPSGSNGGSVVWECDVSSKLGLSGYLNSVKYNPTTDQIAVTIQENGRTVAVFDHKTGNLVSKYQISSGRIHGCSWAMEFYHGTNIKMPDADAAKMRMGNILIVANGLRQAIEVDPKTNPAKVVKQFSYNFGTNQGGTQRLPNGNTFLTAGYSSTLDELDENGSIVWSLKSSGQAMRCYKYGKEYAGVKAVLGTNTFTKPLNEMNKVFNVTHSRINATTTFNFANNGSLATLRVFTLNGEEILSQTTTASHVTLNTNELGYGVYVAKVECASGTLSTRFSSVR